MDFFIGIWTVFAFPSQTAFKYVRQVEKHSSRFRQERRLIVIVLNKNFLTCLYNDIDGQKFPRRVMRNWNLTSMDPAGHVIIKRI